MKQILLSILCLSVSVLFAADDTPRFSIKIIDYSQSWTSSMHYAFSDEEMSVVRVDNVEKNKQDTLSHRQLLGKEKEKIYRYLSILSQIKFQKEYRDANGDRNQKRIVINVNDDEEQSIFISNAFQQDLSALITFLNSFVTEKNKMKEFTDPNKPKQQARASGDL